jgi:hypothetical protein
VEATLKSKARWPTDIVTARDTELRARLTALDAELAPLRTLVKDARHPWKIILWLALIAGALLTFMAFSSAKPLGWITLTLSIVAALYALRKTLHFERILNGHRDALDARLLNDVLQIAPLDLPDAPLSIYADAGYIPGYDRIDNLTAYRHNSRDLIQAKLSRREETKDSKGKTQVRYVTVFNGILFNLPFPDMPGPARTIISTLGKTRPGGIFTRTDRNGRKIKLKSIKTSSLEFNKHHDVLTDDQVLGHTVLDPDRIMRLINLEHDLSETRRGRMRYALLITEGRAWFAIRDVSAPTLHRFPEGDALAQTLSKAHEAVSLPSVIAHHLRLPDDTPNAAPSAAAN